MKRLFLTAALLLAAILPLPRTAAAEVSLVVNDAPYMGELLIERDRICVPLRRFCEELGCRVDWDGGNRGAAVTGRGVSAWFSCGGGSFLRHGVMYTPVRALSAAFGGSALWDAAEKTARITLPLPSFTEDELLLLARIVQAEAGGEPMEGKIAVANTVLTRVASKEFPDTIYEVIFDRKYGVQYEPTANGTIWNTPDEDSLEAAERALSGETVVENCLYFFNPDKASGTWITENRRYVTAIGNHVFYA